MPSERRNKINEINKEILRLEAALIGMEKVSFGTISSCVSGKDDTAFEEDDDTALEDATHLEPEAQNIYTILAGIQNEVDQLMCAKDDEVELESKVSELYEIFTAQLKVFTSVTLSSSSKELLKSKIAYLLASFQRLLGED